MPDKNPPGQKPTRTKAHPDITHPGKSQSGQKPLENYNRTMIHFICMCIVRNILQKSDLMRLLIQFYLEPLVMFSPGGVFSGWYFGNLPVIIMSSLNCSDTSRIMQYSIMQWLLSKIGNNM